MEKAYDLKALGLELKAQGLDLAEDVLKNLVEAVLTWFEKSAALSETPYDNMAMVLMPELKKLILAQIDRIDGQEG